ncbi:hypothetical protein PHYSODRAFT_476353 [Phytophthora sojae]|uniref:Uncharacterized protein n=1 Tax=Phytophthora sojae (strain P6497) TaxID=1094619 RepID=G4YIM7_PHYSP|nr:hypothetical protein PHYSODRAFT_476353 [Phytophthora sojae]EGZ28151.1 hypothetical protein PHYSODRAFT_476353 [Phytophthora sojae]|eukprot:XP_009515426.1 hypothetical protein PHYSODRAFT_476353 [Phytophthora sojae]
MSEDAASSSSSARSHDHGGSPRWSSVQSAERSPRRSVMRTMEKSVVFRALRLKQRGGSSETNDTDVHETLTELYAEVERKKQWLNSEEETFRRGQERLSSLQREHAELLDTLKQCKRRRKERVRIQGMLRGPQAEEERKRLRRFQSDVSLRFQLLQSECRRSDLQVERAMADLRREYADSCLFGNSLNF